MNDNPETNAQHTPNTPENSALPVFHGQLCLSEAQKFLGHADWVGIFPTSNQRFCRFISGFVSKFTLAAAVIAVLFLPDFILDYAHRSEKFIEFFWLIIAGSLAIVLIASLLLTVLHETRLYFSPTMGKLILGRELSERYAQDSLALSDIKEFKIEPPSGIFKRSRLIALCDDAGYLIAETFGNHDDLIELRDWLTEAASHS